MLKVLVASVASLFLVTAASLVACDGSDDSQFKDEPLLPDAEDGPISSLVPDAGEAGLEAGPESCTPKIPDGFTPTWKPPTRATACTTAQIDAYWTACLVDPGTTEGDGTCAAWKADAANAACATCAEPDDKSGPIQWQQARAFYTINVAGCISEQQGKPEVGECGEAYNAAVQCSRASCEFCFGLGGSFDQFRDCQKEVANEGLCKSYETVQSNACSGIREPDAGTLGCFNSGTESQKVHFSRVVGLLCGP